MKRSVRLFDFLSTQNLYSTIRLLFLLTLVCTEVTSAQTFGGGIRGTITDPSGASIAGLVRRSSWESKVCQQLTPRPERVCLVVFVLLAAVPLFAQNAELSGYITDPDGLAVPNARIVVDSVETGVKRAMISNQRGECSVPALPPGGYNLTVEADRFKTTLRDGVVLAVGQRARVGFSLTLGSNTESISVLGGAPLVNISDASVSTVVGNRESPPQSRFAAS